MSMKAELYKTLQRALELTNLADTEESDMPHHWACCREGVYGPVRVALEIVCPGAVDHWAYTGEWLPLEVPAPPMPTYAINGVDVGAQPSERAAIVAYTKQTSKGVSKGPCLGHACTCATAELEDETDDPRVYQQHFEIEGCQTDWR